MTIIDTAFERLRRAIKRADNRPLTTITYTSTRPHMEHIVCSIRDAAVEAFGPPFFVPRIGAAMRAFTDAINNTDGNTALNKHADDHDLYQLGIFDDNTGMITSLPQPRILAKGKEVKLT